MKLNDAIMRERRRPGTGTLVCRYAARDCGTAAWRNLSRTGAAIWLDRAVRPGERLTLEFASPLEMGRTHRLNAQVAWCHAADGGAEAGLRILRDDPDAVLAFANLDTATVNKNEDGEVETKAWSHLRVCEQSTPTTAPAA